MEFKNLDEVKQFIFDLTLTYKLDIKEPYTIQYSNRMRRTIGRCRETRLFGKPIKYQFTYNIKFLTDHLKNSKVIENTVLHEIAHAIVGGRNHHNNIWKAQHKAMGGDGKIFFTKEA